MIACHGNANDKILDKHGKEFPLSNLYNAPLMGEKYVGPPKMLQQSLEDKRKIFLINCCRGTREDKNHAFKIKTEPKC